MSRSPAEPKTAIRPPPREAAERCEQVEDGLERDRAVREVDDDPERLTELDPLHPTGHEGHARQALPDRRRVEPDRLAERDDRQGVVDVEPPDELEVHGGRPGRGLIGDAEPPGVLLDAGRADVGGRVRAVGQDARTGLLGHPDERARRRVVGVDDPGRGPRIRLVRVYVAASGPAMDPVRASFSNRRSFASR